MPKTLLLLSMLCSWTALAKPSQPAAPAAMLKEAALIQRKTAQLRGLTVRRPIPMGLQDRDAILAKVERKLSRDYTPEEIDAEAAVWKRLGLIDAGLDYRREVLALLQDQVAGYYDPTERRLNLADWLPLSFQAPALSHEICHALQDQHFNIKPLLKPLKDNTDKQLAQAALLEGDCTGVMLEYELAAKQLDLSSIDESQLQLLSSAITAGGSAKFKAAPRFLRETLLFPYLYGLKLIRKVRATHPWSAVNQLFKNLPASTEQVMHPEKYWKHESPVQIRPGSLPSLEDFTRTRQDVLGEFNLYLLLSQTLETTLAARASEGWGGDLLQSFESSDGGPLLIVHLSTWDSQADAIEFANAVRHWLISRRLKPQAPTKRPDAGQPQPAGADQLWVYQEQDQREWSVQRVSEHVLLLAGAPNALRSKLQQEVWAEWRIAGKRIRPPSLRPVAR